MNNFSSPSADSTTAVPKHLESLATTVFQSLFPPIMPQTTPLKAIHRVVLLNREQNKDDDGSFLLNFRHYAITTRATGISKPLRRLNAAERLLAAKAGKKGGVPNLGKLEDIADFMIGGEGGEGYMTDGASDSEVDTDAEVEVFEAAPTKIQSGKAGRTATAQSDEMEIDEDGSVERLAVKLVELGPRMKLRLTKVEEGLASGKVMWHEYVSKSREEERELETRWEKRRQEKEARRKLQRDNVEKKKAAKASGNSEANDDADSDASANYSYDSELGMVPGEEGEADDIEWSDE
jgi:ribosome biogenesis protein SSF1/2